MTTLALRPAILRRPAAKFGLMADLYRSRRALAALDADALADIGLTAAEAQAEARRLPWDLPQAWRRCGC